MESNIESEILLVKLFSERIVKMIYILDTIGSSQIFFPSQNLERAHQVDEESEVVL